MVIGGMIVARGFESINRVPAFEVGVLPVFVLQGFIPLLLVECSGAEHWSVPGDELQHQVQRAVQQDLL
jgi:hypothetical protein